LFFPLATGAPAPCSPLFPYTTLFRSLLKAAGAKRALLLPVSAPFHSSLMKPAALRLQAALEKVTQRAGHSGRQQHRRRHAGRRQDRKSTRLNSSHLGISYAVFCLKKK